ncbi:MAG: hypothetical protein JNK82_20685 [Myxococcaceae bacterium]|nr:hypothetical protein [Myxococcaceae bacterium]
MWNIVAPERRRALERPINSPYKRGEISGVVARLALARGPPMIHVARSARCAGGVEKCLSGGKILFELT